MENKSITFTFVSEQGKQRFYESSKPLIYGYNRLLSKIEIYNPEEIRNIINDKYKHLLKEDGFNVICISDAREHFERLAFAAIYFNGTYGRLNMQLEGLHTFLSEGGDIDSMWEDEKYLRLIARHNGYSQGNVTIIK